jgi:hypothetical protein
LLGFALATSIYVRERNTCDNKLRGTPRGSRKKPNAGRSPTCRLSTADANSHMACHAHAALCRGLEKSLSERHGRGKARAPHGHGMVCVNQTRPYCVNQMGKTQSKLLAARHGRGTAWARHGMCELSFSLRLANSTGQKPFNALYRTNYLKRKTVQETLLMKRVTFHVNVIILLYLCLCHPFSYQILPNTDSLLQWSSD